MTRKEKRLKRKRKAEKKKMRKLWYKGNVFQLKNYMIKHWVFMPYSLMPKTNYYFAINGRSREND